MASTIQDWYRKNRQATEKLFAEIVGDKRMATDQGFTSISPSGKFQLKVSVYDTSPKRPSWRFSRGLVTRVSDGSVVADIKRDYGQFPFAWVRQTDTEYLICGEHYQSYSVVNLAEGNTKVYVPDLEKGDMFCWTAIKPSPNGLRLMVDGCYWAAEYELRMYDFSKPTQPPFPVAARLSYLYGDPYGDSGYFLFKAWEWIDDENIELEVRAFKAGGQEEVTTKRWSLSEISTTLASRSVPAL